MLGCRGQRIWWVAGSGLFARQWDSRNIEKGFFFRRWKRLRARIVKWATKCNESVRRLRIGFCLERGDWWVEVRCTLKGYH